MIKDESSVLLSDQIGIDIGGCSKPIIMNDWYIC